LRCVYCDIGDRRTTTFEQVLLTLVLVRIIAEQTIATIDRAIIGLKLWVVLFDQMRLIDWLCPIACV
jgi:hypothetical protein